MNIKEEEKKIIINENKEINLEKIKMKNEEMIEILINEIKETKEKEDKEKEKIEELKKSNEEKERRIKILENNYNKIKEKSDELEYYKKDKNIDLIYYTEKEGKYNIFEREFVENNKIKIILN